MFPHTLMRPYRRALIGIGFGALAAQAALAVPTLSISAPNTPVRYGDTLVLQVAVSDIADLYAYQFTMHFDPVVFQAMSVNEGTFLQGGGDTFFDRGTMDNTAGDVSFVLGSLLGSGPGVSGAGVLGTLRFRVVTQQSTTATFSYADVLAVNSVLAPIALQASTYTATVVPEPATFTMMATALAALGGLSLRRRTARAVRHRF